MINTLNQLGELLQRDQEVFYDIMETLMGRYPLPTGNYNKDAEEREKILLGFWRREPLFFTPFFQENLAKGIRRDLENAITYPYIG